MSAAPFDTDFGPTDYDDPQPETETKSKVADRRVEPPPLVLRLGSEYTWPAPRRQWVSTFMAIATGRPTMLCAPPGVGKGWLGQLLQWGVASGEPIGDLGVFGGPGSTLWLDYEEGDDELWRRHARIRAGRIETSVDDSKMAYLDCTMTGKERQLSSAVFRAQLEQAMKGRLLCVIDGLTDCYEPEDRNQPDARIPIRVMAELSTRTGCAVVFIYHPRKGQTGEGKPGADVPLQDIVRGSGAIPGALGSIWVGDHQKSGGTRWRHAKCNGRQQSPAFAVTWRDEEDGGICIDARLLPEAPEEGGKALRDSEETVAIQQLILSIVSERPGENSETVVALVGKNAGRVRSQMALLVAHRQIHIRYGARTAKHYWPGPGTIEPVQGEPSGEGEN